MRSLLFTPFGLAVLGFAAPALLGDARTQYEAGQQYRMEFATSLATETTEFEFLRDGEPQGGGFNMGPSEKSVHFVCVDRLLGAEGGEPSALDRQFEDLSLVQTTVRRDEEQTIEGESPFDGVVLHLETGADGQVVATVQEGDAPDAELLENFELRQVLDHLLVEAEATPGATWEIGAADLRAVLMQSEEQRLFKLPAREPAADGSGRGGGRRGGGQGRGGGGIFPEAEWTGKATWTEATEELDGQDLAVIELEFEASGDLPEPQGFGGRGGRLLGAPALVGNTYEYALEGRLLYSTREKRPVKLELAGDLTTHSEQIMERDTSTIEIRSTRVTYLESSIHVTVQKTQQDQ